MRKICTILAAALLLTSLLVSCRKQAFPKTDDLAGSWTEITENPAKTSLHFVSGDLLYMTHNSGTTDTLTYRLDKKEKRIYLKLANYPGTGESYFRICLNKKSDILSIWGLYQAIPEAEPQEVKFQKI